MRQDDFMVDTYYPHDTVTVNARELQDLIRAKSTLEKANKSLRLRVETLTELLDRPLVHVDLRV